MKAKQLDEIEKEAVPFNMSMLYYLGLNKILEKKDSLAAIGDTQGWFRSLKAVYRRTKFKFNKKERENLDGLFKKVAPYFEFSTSHSDRLNFQLKKTNYSVAEPILEEIDTELWDLLHAYSMIFPNIKGYGSLDDLDKRFGLQKKDDEDSDENDES